MRQSARALLDLVLGQLVAVVALAVARALTYTNDTLVFVVIACVLVDVAVLLGMRLACREAYNEGYERAVNYEREE